LSIVYHYFGCLYQHFNDEDLKEKVRERLRFINITEAIGLSYMLTPKYAANGFYFDEDQTKIIGFAKNFSRRFNFEGAETVQEDMIAYVTKMSTLPTHLAEIVFQMSAKSYWNTIGRRDFPRLFEIAKPIVEMICSSATAERTWSTFKFVHSRLRNRLSNEKVQKLVFLYTNSVILDEKDKMDYILEDGAVINETDYENESTDQNE
jgi:hAT family C-terminal dimerisation region